MAVTNIIRRTASQVVPLAVRVIGRTQNYSYRSSALFSTVVNRAPAASRTFFRSVAPSTVRCYSSNRPSSDEALVKIIQSEIQCAEESDEHEPDQVDEVPAGFPFKIEDTPGQQTITLTREYQDETIKVEVHMPDLVTGDENENVIDDDSERPEKSQVPLVVSVCKKNGTCLEFSCTAFADEIAIDNLSIKDTNAAEDQIAYEGPDFEDLDENLQKAFHKYLEIRGIKPSATNFLHLYMINKDGREYVTWLKNLKKFVEA